MESAGTITVWYRGPGGHLNMGQEATSSSLSLQLNLFGQRTLIEGDFGHAFVVVRDKRTGSRYYLDGWKEQKEFKWNTSMDFLRMADHHSISIEINSNQLKAAITAINGFLNSSRSYELFSFNCANSVVEVLRSVGIHIDTFGILSPRDLERKLVRYLTANNIPYTNNDVCE